MMDAVLAMMPSDAQVRYSAMTGQSLFYMDETNLKHRTHPGRPIAARSKDPDAGDTRETLLAALDAEADTEEG